MNPWIVAAAYVCGFVTPVVIVGGSVIWFLWWSGWRPWMEDGGV
jgi:hypothetical protein